MELLKSQESSKKEETKRNKSNQKSIKLFDDQVLSKFDEGQNSETKKNQSEVQRKLVQAKSKTVSKKKK